MESVATPEESVPVPSVAEPLLKVTVSPFELSVPTAKGLSVAVSATDAP